MLLMLVRLGVQSQVVPNLLLSHHSISPGGCCFSSPDLFR